MCKQIALRKRSQGAIYTLERVTTLKTNSKLIANFSPIRNGHSPLFGDVSMRQVEELANGLVSWENRFVLDDLAQLSVVPFNGVRRINNTSHFSRVVKESRQFCPVVLPRTDGSRIFVPPLFSNKQEIGLSLFTSWCFIDRFE